jgi:hypothetical protein
MRSFLEVPMKKRRKKILDVGIEARRAARNSGIAPSATRVIADKRKRATKHKKKWLEREAE